MFPLLLMAVGLAFANVNDCRFFLSPQEILARAEALQNTRVVVTRHNRDTSDVGYISYHPHPTGGMITLHKSKATDNPGRGQMFQPIPLSALVSITPAPPRFIENMGGGYLELPSGDVVGPYGSACYVSIADAHGDRRVARILSLDRHTLEMVLEVPFMESGTLVRHEVIPNAAQVASLRLSSTSRETFARLDARAARLSSTPPSRDSWPEVPSSQSIEVMEILARARAAHDPAAALGENGIGAIYDITRGSLPPPALQPQYSTALDSARSYGMRQIEDERYEDGTALTMARLGTLLFTHFPADAWFRTQLNPDRLDGSAYRPKVYVNLPVGRMAQALPLIVEAAQKHHAYQMKLPARWEHLQRDDRVVIHFNSLPEAVAAARQLATLMTSLGVTGMAPAFTMTIGRGPVGLGFDPPNEGSWRYFVARTIRDALVAYGGDWDRVLLHVEQQGIYPGMWIPKAVLVEVMNALSVR